MGLESFPSKTSLGDSTTDSESSLIFNNSFNLFNNNVLSIILFF